MVLRRVGDRNDQCASPLVGTPRIVHLHMLCRSGKFQADRPRFCGCVFDEPADTHADPGNDRCLD